MNKLKKQLQKEALSLLPSESEKQAIFDNVNGLMPQTSQSNIISNSNSTVAVAKTRQTKRFALSLVSVACICLLLMVGLFAGGVFTPTRPSDSYVVVDIAPSVLIKTTTTGEVLSVKELSVDAGVLLFAKDYSKSTLTQVITDIVKTSQKMSYVSDEEITVFAVNDNSSAEKEIVANLQENLPTAFNLGGINNKINVQAQKKSNGKDILIDKLALTSNTPKKELKKLALSDLVALLQEDDEDEIQNFLTKMNGELNTHIKALKEEYATKTATYNRVLMTVSDILDKLDDEKYPKYFEKLSYFNSTFADYAYDGDPNDYSNAEEYFENLNEEIEDILDDLEDKLEDSIDELKVLWKNNR